MTNALYIARHGETDFNREGRVQGQTDCPLNDLGRAQAKTLAERLRGLGIARVGASTLGRATETAQICASILGIPFDYSDPELRERSFGAFEGRTFEELKAHEAGAFRKWQADRHFTPEGAETFEALANRVTGAVGRAFAELQRMEGGLLLISHGGAMRALFLTYAGAPKPPIQNCAAFRVAMEGERPVRFDPI